MKAFDAGCFLWKKKTTVEEEERDPDITRFHETTSPLHEQFTSRLVPESSMDKEFERGTGPKKFSYKQLADATNNFSKQLKLGVVGFGSVYRGFLEEIGDVAVKKISRDSKQGIKEYESEVKIISQLRHKNLVHLLGWCHEISGELILVYSFMPNRSLDYHLFGEESITLPWDVRYKVARGLASAISYIHEDWELCVLHRDIKSSNVMLDSNFNARLGDFGLARLVDHEKASQTTSLAGTLGYMAPEYINTGRASKASDVYSLGVVLLEIACGRKAFSSGDDQRNPIRLVQWVRDLYSKGKLLDAADPKLRQQFDPRKMENLIITGLWCVDPDDGRRPPSRQVINILNLETPLWLNLYVHSNLRESTKANGISEEADVPLIDL